MYLVDSTIYIDWMRTGHSPVRMLAPYIRSQEALTCGVVRVEVIRGIVNPRVRDELEMLFDLLPTVETSAAIWRSATELAWKLDRKGKVLPISDLVIAVCAQSTRSEVISLDRHFGAVPDLVWNTKFPS
jgi:predicted nucleic acid-binding protein